LDEDSQQIATYEIPNAMTSPKSVFGTHDQQGKISSTILYNSTDSTAIKRLMLHSFFKKQPTTR